MDLFSAIHTAIQAPSQRSVPDFPLAKSGKESKDGGSPARTTGHTCNSRYKLGIGPLAGSQALALGVYDVRGGVNKSLRAPSGFINSGYPKAYYLPM